MTTIEWLEQNARGFQAISQDAREAVMHFSFLWSLFEFEAMDRHADGNALVAVARRWAGAHLLDDEPFERALRYFREKYCRDGEFTRHFDFLNLPDGAHRELVRRVLMNEDAERSEIASAVLIIVYRFRNNLFHGEKWLYEIQGQFENFNHANAVLMQAVELYRRLPDHR